MGYNDYRYVNSSSGYGMNHSRSSYYTSPRREFKTFFILGYIFGIINIYFSIKSSIYPLYKEPLFLFWLTLSLTIARLCLTVSIYLLFSFTIHESITLFKFIFSPFFIFFNTILADVIRCLAEFIIIICCILWRYIVFFWNRSYSM